MDILDSINKENDIKNVDMEDMPALAEEIRGFILGNVSRTGGHLASNLGAVELTMALHLCMDFPADKLIFDVGHQAYTHKILTGRKDDFYKLRQYGGLSGFPKISESDSDAFNTGHSSTSISAALGLVKARELRGTVLHAVTQSYTLYGFLGQTQTLAAAHATINEGYLHVVQYVKRRD